MLFIGVKENRIVAVDQQLNSRRASIAENQLKLCSIAATVILCGRQGFVFQEYDEDWFDIVDEASTRRLGNIHSLLRFRVDASDEILKEHLHSANHNAMYTSKEIQNQLIGICGDIIRNKLLQKIKASKFFQ